MHPFSILATCSLLVANVLAHHVLHEKRGLSPADWEMKKNVDLSSVIPLKIALKQKDLHLGEKFLYDVSHPRSRNYGKHWTAKEVAEKFAPSQASVKAVKDWLHGSGINPMRIKQAQSLGWLHVNTTVREAQTLLKTEYFVYEHTVTGIPHIACNEYHVPIEVSAHVDFITPTVHFDTPMNIKHRRSVRPPPAPPAKKRDRQIRRRNVRTLADAQAVVDTDGEVPMQRAGVTKELGTSLGSLPKQGAILADNADVGGRLDRCDQAITPACLRALYGYNESMAGGNAKNSYGIVEYSPQSYNQQDLDKYFSNFSRPAMGSQPVLRPIDGGVVLPANRSFNINGESNLDLEYAMAIVAPMKVNLYQVGDDVQGASFNNFLDALDSSYCKFEGGDDPTQDAVYPTPLEGYIGPAQCGGFAASKVISTSYGYNEADLTPAYADRQCAEYLKLALQGVTILYSSGDFGVAGNMGRCIDPKTGNFTRTNATDGVFNPSFPSGCPWVTSVGATEVPPATNVVQALASNTQPEVACETVIRSGGGFSNMFEMPEYQKVAVKGWFSDHPPVYGASLFNNTQKTRGFPDIAVNGANYVITVGGNFSLIYGTSASAPALGGILTLINEQRLNAGKNTIGFINPVLYENPQMMKDVVKGQNRGCGTTGFDATTGWDPLTGLGTPIFPKMLEVFMGLP
ncbi:subtilisin-like protein [Microthyrium microscopicum]|uniref:tripeptidyl-peptidase II n=1 Tax=Microthyrium microscopicum TaxID=703497 RepID=A0A6A6UTG4_9PEZI|nr:subtilisin-like protein [Microthyrium microscopicum]